MTERDQYKRPTAKECLEHSWFMVKHSKKPLKRVLNNLKVFGTDLTEEIGEEEERGIKFFTSSPLIIRKRSEDNYCRNSFSDMQMLPYGKNDDSFTSKVQEVFLRLRAKSVCRTKSSQLNNTINPFFPIMIPEEEEVKQSKPVRTNEGPDDEIPSELELGSPGSINISFATRVRASITGPEGVSKRLLTNSRRLYKIQKKEEVKVVTIPKALRESNRCEKSAIFQKTNTNDTKASRREYFSRRINLG